MVSIFRNKEPLCPNNDLSEYLSTIGDKFCPFLNPSLLRGCTLFTVYEFPNLETRELQERIFYLGYLHTELLRMARRDTIQVSEKILLCENLIFRFANENTINGKEILDWPHWALKLLYTKTGILFGKFWKGEKELSTSGVPIPKPPYHLLSIRSGVKERDTHFFKKARFLLEDFINATDTGRSVLPESCINQPRYCAKLFCEKPTPPLAETLLLSLMDSGLYEYALSLSENEV